jgi:hypothetical protein
MPAEHAQVLCWPLNPASTHLCRYLSYRERCRCTSSTRAGCSMQSHLNPSMLNPLNPAPEPRCCCCCPLTYMCGPKNPARHWLRQVRLGGGWLLLRLQYSCTLIVSHGSGYTMPC